MTCRNTRHFLFLEFARKKKARIIFEKIELLNNNTSSGKRLLQLKHNNVHLKHKLILNKQKNFIVLRILCIILYNHKVFYHVNVLE